MSRKIILRTVVGSQAQGLATPDSDTDIRGVFVVRTEEVLGLREYKDFTNEFDDTHWEVKKFCLQALKCNPTILETLAGIPRETTDEGEKAT